MKKFKIDESYRQTIIIIVSHIVAVWVAWEIIAYCNPKK